MSLGFFFPHLKNFTGAERQNIAQQSDEVESHCFATLFATGKRLICQQSGLMHEAVSIMVDAIQTATRHTFTRPKLPHKSHTPRTTHGQMSYTSIPSDAGTHVVSCSILKCFTDYLCHSYSRIFRAARGRIKARMSA